MIKQQSNSVSNNGVWEKRWVQSSYYVGVNLAYTGCPKTTTKKQNAKYTPFWVFNKHASKLLLHIKKS